jgi:ribokinase
LSAEGRAPRIAVVGHVEWVDFAVVPRLPRRGEILHAREHFQAPGGGGAVAAVIARRLAGHCLFLTAVGNDARGAQARDDLGGLYEVEVHAAVRDKPQRRTFTFLDDAERTITVLGERLVPHGGDPLPWERLDDVDAVYFTGGDPEALKRCRAARVLVATPRAADALEVANVQVDVLVGSATDPDESGMRFDPPPHHVVLTEGASGGRWVAGEGGEGGEEGRWAAAATDGPVLDSYGCGDSFAAGLTYALGAGATLQAALEVGAREGARCLSRRGPY